MRALESVLTYEACWIQAIKFLITPTWPICHFSARLLIVSFEKVHEAEIVAFAIALIAILYNLLTARPIRYISHFILESFGNHIIPRLLVLLRICNGSSCRRAQA